MYRTALQDINLVNISILVAGLFYFLGPLLSESMASREKALALPTDLSDCRTPKGPN